MFRYYLLLSLCLTSFVAQAKFDKNIANKESMLLVEFGSGKVIKSSDANHSRYPASLTKLMTSYIVFEAIKHGKIKLNNKIKISHNAAKQPPSKLGIIEGKYITVKQALIGSIVRSANDSTVLLAEYIAGSEKKFAQIMNHMSQLLGMHNTHFVNSTGLPHPKQITTANDIAKLSIALMRDHPKLYRYFFNIKSFKYEGKKFDSRNRLLTNYNLPGKTGYTDSSGYNMMISFKKNRKKLVAVVIGHPKREQRDKVMVNLLASHVGEIYFDQQRKLNNIHKKLISKSKFRKSPSKVKLS